MQSQSSSTFQTYLDTIAIVIKEVHPYFLEEGAEDVLLSLKNIWIKKLNQAIDLSDQKNEVPIKITMPDRSIFMLSVPKTSQGQNKLQDALTDPVTTAIISLPRHVRSPMLKNYAQQTFNDLKKTLNASNSIAKRSETATTSRIESESTSSASADNSSISNEDTEENDEDSLNSEDDVTDEEKFSTDNIILCQYHKIFRQKNKWKLNLTNGIMNLDGKDYIFATLKGEATW